MRATDTHINMGGGGRSNFYTLPKWRILSSKNWDIIIISKGQFSDLKASFYGGHVIHHERHLLKQCRGIWPIATSKSPWVHSVYLAPVSSILPSWPQHVSDKDLGQDQGRWQMPNVNPDMLKSFCYTKEREREKIYQSGERKQKDCGKSMHVCCQTVSDQASPHYCTFPKC